MIVLRDYGTVKYFIHCKFFSRPGNVLQNSGHLGWSFTPTGGRGEDSWLSCDSRHVIMEELVRE